MILLCVCIHVQCVLLCVMPDSSRKCVDSVIVNVCVYTQHKCIFIILFACVCAHCVSLMFICLWWIVCMDCCVALVLVLNSHNIPQLYSSLFITTPHLLYLQEQRQRATTFTKRLKKVFDNLEWMFLRGRVLKQVEQASDSREFPSPDSTELHHQGKQRKKRTVTSEPQSTGRSVVE